ncbi:MAG: TRAP transporter substrate-binding protein [Candidatus Velthaea sp.]
MSNRSMSRRRILVGGAGIFASIGILRLPAHAAEFTLRYGNDLPTTHPLNVRMREFSDRLKIETNGRVEMQLFPNNQLGGDTEMLSQLRSGAIQALSVPGGVLATLVPETSITYVGYAFRSYKQVWEAMDGDLGAYCRAAIEKTGLTVLPSIWNNGFNDVYSSVRPINTPEDLAGFKIRTSVSPIFVSTFKSLGAAPTPINLNETYSALQTKLVDGVTDPLAIFELEKFYEVQKYASLTRQMWGGYWFIVNPATWAGLPKQVQETFARLNSAAARKQRADVAKLEDEVTMRLAARGMVVNRPKPEAFVRKLRESGFYAHWRQTFGDNGWRALEKYAGPVG